MHEQSSEGCNALMPAAHGRYLSQLLDDLDPRVDTGAEGVEEWRE